MKQQKNSISKHKSSTDRLVLGVADPSDEQVDQLGAEDEAVEGKWSEPLLHGPLLTGRLIRVQVWVWSMPRCKQHQNKDYWN